MALSPRAADLTSRADGDRCSFWSLEPQERSASISARRCLGPPVARPRVSFRYAATAPLVDGLVHSQDAHATRAPYAWPLNVASGLRPECANSGHSLTAWRTGENDPREDVARFRGALATVAILTISVQ
jgi:hypothetical protein